jgi:NADPH-dependent curcumin reductase CurA
MKQIVLKHALNARPIASDLTMIEAPKPPCPEDGIVAKVLYLSLDPYVGSRLRGAHMGEPAPVPMLEMIPGAIVGRVEQSRSAKFREGDIIHSMDGGWAQWIALSSKSARRINPEPDHLSAHVGVLGMPGLTAWAGMTQLAKTTIGDVVLVDAAAGPVGGTVGQVARINGATRVIGIAGGAEKCALVKERYQFDACIDYKQPNWLDALDAALGSPPTVHFENVGMNILLPALQRLKPYGRIVLCGLVDQYHATTPAPQIPPGLIVAKRAQLFGLVVYDFYPQFDAYVDQATEWIKTGALIYVEDRVRGLENAPAHFERLMRGENVGKAIVVVSDDAQ